MIPKVVGISGCSCSGKSTIARMLRDHITSTRQERVKIICMDNYYHPPENIPMNQDHNVPDWDTVKAFDVEKVLQDINTIFNENDLSLLIIEGILLFDFGEHFSSILHVKVFLDIDMETLIKRRSQRIYPDEYKDPPNYIQNIVYSSHLKSKENLPPGVLILDSVQTDCLTNSQKILEHLFS
jgi:uridine kinase